MRMLIPFLKKIGHWMFFLLFAYMQIWMTLAWGFIVIALIGMTISSHGEEALKAAVVTCILLFVGVIELPHFWGLLWRNRPWA